ncbi:MULTISPECIES: bifunctional methylenetetrahydrofolate dehydrogenase/methenyltetrahydrofolate cyclohydrolase FolD [Piscirickettsiaceae]|jgi:methylenetetrahydrofolate dehydrogenase (NADP+)/methenyltetrahydrofolate cyclohydrolase|uniref:Bifunctional protein FolD n=1 Tax=Hydrogenovibrio thermophilus TaxID=265883 RepID=A0A410H1W8_9GAMM|nr:MULTISPECIES: bifunctional methylenetetrahydrofolate dehydrogenase/methenyltetrahydrofolate cyclohydrolase FolD [Piscirickettsiaceae]AZR82533.1 bifunctional methylenetetrahydrofolate dehydrogenase/methenyltetrahydrofolate cyclohydrolase [Thiomicrospira sp. S5]QAB14906.1 bifunctional methylenetetrahydrofolate dehydrogenase/methenyltetrahydrofolate cyclohydrolase FolD [Hydrogenovibrio thermophilus]
MTAKILDGKAIAQELRESIRAEVDAQVAKGQNPPGLAVILVGEDPASQVYVRNKKIACEKAGFNDVSMVLPADTTEEQLLAEIDTLNARDDVHGIIVQLPVPDHIDPEKIIERIDPKKDVDGFHAYNMGRLATRMPGLAPCTPHGVMTMLEKTGIPLRGLDAVVVGASNIVGVPMALELLNARATVTVCHSATKDLAQKVSEADLVVVGVGIPNMVKGEWIKDGAIVVDVGINRLDDGTLCGDVEYDVAKEKASWITPVPGGVGPMTIATLMQNTLQAAYAQS